MDERNRRIQRGAFILLVALLTISGIFLLFTGWWLPEAPLSDKACGISWLIACIAAILVRKKPYLQFGAVCLWVVVCCWRWWTITDERSLVWFLYQNMLPLACLIISTFICLGAKIRTE